MTIDDYPFEPALRGQEASFRGLEKLRCIEDPALRRQLFALWRHCREPRPHNPAQVALPLDPRAPVIGKLPGRP